MVFVVLWILLTQYMTFSSTKRKSTLLLPFSSLALVLSQDFQVNGQGLGLQSNYTTANITIAQALGGCRSQSQALAVVETTISDVHKAFLDRQLTCSQLVKTYTQRILQYDRQTAVNSIRVLNPKLEDDASEKDEQLQQILDGKASMPKLFCVPVLVKDNFDVVGTATTNGAFALADNLPLQDAYQISLLKGEGAVILAKTNMAEWAFSPDISTGSMFGVVRNPYGTDFSTAGSSGGTAAGVAANFGLVGMGTDTGNSIRGPSGWNSLVGIRPSLGLSSRSGVVPLDLSSDVAGPIGRTVEDTVRVFEVTVGVDPRDNLTTLQSQLTGPQNYTQFLQKDGLQGMRVGVMRQTISPSTADPQVLNLFQAALQDIQAAGATLVDNFTISGNSLGSRPWNGGTTWYTGSGSFGKYEQLDCGARFKFDINNYLGAAHSRFKTVQEVVAEGLLHPTANDSMTVRLDIPYQPSQYPPAVLASRGYMCNCADFYNNPCRAEFRKRLIESMDAVSVDVLVFPTWSNLPGLIGDYAAADGNNSPQISPPTGSPAMVVPMGFARAGSQATDLPASLQILARPFQEGTMIKAAYSYEQATKHRRPPAAFPECKTSAAVPAPAPGTQAALPETAGASAQSFSLGH